MRKYVTLALLCALCAVSTSFARPYFDTSKDLLLCQYDSKPDPDDIHAQAAAGCMLSHSSYSAVKYYAVQGAVGIQNGTYIDSDALFGMAFGTLNTDWTDANSDWWGSVGRIKNKVVATLNGGGKVWVAEAGQSNITADWVYEVLKSVAAATVKSNVIVVQHSKWNEDQTASSDLNYVKGATTYYAIDDGNAPWNGSWGDRGPYSTPEYRSKSTSYMASAKSSQNSKAKQLWTEAERVILQYYPGGYPETWSFIHDGGVDFSDTAEIWWILDDTVAGNNVDGFWSKFVTNDTGEPPPPPPPPPATAGTWIESNGLVVIEPEHAELPANWRIRPKTFLDDPSMAGSLGDGWIEWYGAQYYGNTQSDSAANGIISLKVEIKKAGTYRFRWRSKQYNVGTFDAGNDSFVKFASGSAPSGYQDFGSFTKAWVQSKTAWSWRTTFEPHHGTHYADDLVRRNFTVGTHTIQIAARSPGHAIDRIVMHHTDMAFNEANFNAAAESERQGNGGTNNDTISADELPTSIGSETSYTVTVPYTADTARDVVVEFWNTGWLGQGRTAVSAGSGTATVTVPIDSGTAPADGSGYLWKISIRPTGGGWQTNIDSKSKGNVTVSSGPSADTIATTALPTSVESADTLTVSVPYTATQQRDVVVEFWNTGWLGQGRATVNKGEGTATVTVPLSGGAPAAGSGYLWKTSIRPVGGGWQTNIDSKSKTGVTVTASGGTGGGAAAYIGKTIAFKAGGNNNYAIADGTADSVNWPVMANRNTVGGYGKIIVVDAGSGYVALRASANWKFISANNTLNAQANRLAANKTTITDWEKFEWIDNADGTVSLKAIGNGKHVCADRNLDATNWPLAANRTAIGAWEKFTVEVQ